MALMKSKKDVLRDIRGVWNTYLQHPITQNLHGCHVNLVIVRDNTNNVEANLRRFLYHMVCDFC